MANEAWEEIDKQHNEFEQHYCAFIDILGYKEHSKRFFAGNFNLYGRFKRAIEHAHKTNNASRIFVSSELLKISFFSDSIIISHPVQESNEDALFNVLHACCTFSAILSYEGLFLRGGISKGRHFERTDKNLNSSFLCSEALQEAYELESNEAVYPRILVHENVISDLSGIANNLVAKNDKFHFLHYSPLIINSKGSNLKDVKNEMEDIYKLYQSFDSQRVREKYEWVLSYYHWTLSLIAGVDLKQFEKFNVGKQFKFNILTN